MRDNSIEIKQINCAYLPCVHADLLTYTYVHKHAGPFCAFVTHAVEMQWWKMAQLKPHNNLKHITTSSRSLWIHRHCKWSKLFRIPEWVMRANERRGEEPESRLRSQAKKMSVVGILTWLHMSQREENQLYLGNKRTVSGDIRHVTLSIHECTLRDWL